MTKSNNAPRCGGRGWFGGARAAMLITGALLGGGVADAATIFVNAGLVGGADNGTSWEDAYRGPGALATALTAAVAGDSIWVAQGTYKPTTTATRTISLNLKAGVGVFGGFEGDETSLDERDFVTNVTILSGDLAGNDGAGVLTDNSHHVVSGAGAGATAVLDGFTVRGGNANGSSAGDHDRGGGLLLVGGSHGTFRNCRVVSNRCTFGGGAGYVRSSSPSFTDCTFESNLGGSFGGAFDTFQSSAVSWTRCSFIGNSAARAGGVEAFGQCTPTLVNCVFLNNTSTGSGGGGAMYIASGSTATLRNCTITRNSANVTVGGVLTSGSTTRITNSIVYGNSGPGGSMTVGQQITHTGSGLTGALYSDVQGGYPGAGNINADPLFVDSPPPSGDVRLRPGSPAIDAGDNSGVPAGVTTDRAGLPRFHDDPGTPDTGLGTPPIVDMGAHEFQGNSCVADFDGDGAVTVSDFLAFLSAFAAGEARADVNGDGVVTVGDFLAYLGLFAAGC